MKKILIILLAISSLALSATVFADTYEISWSQVTQYTDNSLIESGNTVTYAAYWSLDNTFPVASLKQIGDNSSLLSRTFDPDALNIPRRTVIYFTAKTILATGEQSSLAPAYPYAIAGKTPGKPIHKVIRLN